MRFLVPASHLVPSYLEAMREHHQADGMPDADGLTWDDLKGRTLEDYTADLAAGVYPRPGTEPGVAGTELWWCAEPTRDAAARYVGRASIRHRVVLGNHRSGGNLWWSIRPSMRGKGLGTRLLIDVLPLLVGHGIRVPMITALEEDTARRRVLEKCGAMQTSRKGEVVAYLLDPRQLHLRGPA